MENMKKQFKNAKELETVINTRDKESRYVLIPRGTVEKFENYYMGINHTITDNIVYEVQDVVGNFIGYAIGFIGTLAFAYEDHLVIENVESFKAYRPIKHF